MYLDIHCKFQKVDKNICTKRTNDLLYIVSNFLTKNAKYM